MRYTEFRDLCYEQYEARQGDIIKMYLTPPSKFDLTTDLIELSSYRSPFNGGAGVVIETIENPVTGSPVSICLVDPAGARGDTEAAVVEVNRPGLCPAEILLTLEVTMPGGPR